MNGADIRETFLRFFEEREHTRVRSSSLVPPAESGLLLTNAGMNQFIPYFLGQAQAPYPRAVTAQKVMRTNDIDNVGHDARHLTCFEMLGNFSFADYFKADAVAWAYELVTEVYGIEHDRLWVTVYEDDDETPEAWLDIGHIDKERIVTRGAVDAEGEPANYWWTHAAGPAGPCSEIFVDRGPAYGPDGGPDVDEERFMEIWNLVFMQDQVDGERTVVAPLPGRNVDTGSSLERVATVLQGVDDVFQTDLFLPTLEVAESLSGKRHGADPRDDISLKVIAEHGRATAFLIGDGVLPANNGRGYILRRMLRRAIAHARRLGIEHEVLPPVVASVVEGFGDAYPELRENAAFIQEVVASEEERFAATLRQGMVLFGEARGRASGGVVSGDDAFKLSDTFGFPVELTIELAADEGLQVDEDRFRALLQEQRDRARRAAKKVEIGLDTGAVPPTEFVGYERPEAESSIGLLLDDDNAELEVAEEGQPVRLFLARTPFYAEGGGQVGDRGVIRTPTGAIRVTDTQKAGDLSIVHDGRGGVRRGPTRPGRGRRDRPLVPRRHRACPHVDPRDPRDAAADPGRPRATGGLLDRAGAAPVRLLAPKRRADRGPGGGGARIEPASRGRRQRPRVAHVDGRGQGARRDGVVRREVRRCRAGGRDRRLLARAVRRHARRPHRQGRRDPAAA